MQQGEIISLAGNIATGAKLGVKGAKAAGAAVKTANAVENASNLKYIHGNSLKSTRPTWGYKLYSNDGTFLKNGITSKVVSETRYTKTFMETHRMVPYKQFPNRLDAWKWEYQQNSIQRGPLNFNMH